MKISSIKGECARWLAISTFILSICAVPLQVEAQKSDSAVRQEVINALPEAMQIGNAELRQRVYEAWAAFLAKHGHKQIHQLPAQKEPGSPALQTKTRLEQTRSVTRLVVAVVSDMKKHQVGFDVDMDELLSAALVHKIDSVLESRWPEKTLVGEIVLLADRVFWIIPTQEQRLAERGLLRSPGSGEAPLMRMGRRMKVDETIRQGIIQSFPEAKLLKNQELRERFYDAWTLSLSLTSFKRMEEISGSPGIDSPHLRNGSQADHLRGTGRLAVVMGEELKRTFPEFEPNPDELLSGGMLHDLGKAYEYDPGNQTRWRSSPKRTGFPALRHPAYGVYIALTAGLPEEICHIVSAHSAEGLLIRRSTAAEIVHEADHGFWTITRAAGLLTK